ncbi:hypothetical protein NX059_010436 [Plenodomus lindquistii]|nr:hypothetical protein NX059_010436 [Plenodomus lindquistii]
MPGSLAWTTPNAACTGVSGRQLKESQMSFPSGHAAAAFAGFGFLAMYLNAKYKIFGHGRRSGLGGQDNTTAPSTSAAGEKTTAAAGKGGRIQHWKLVLFALPWLIAILISLSKVRDGWHHPVDVIVGALIGTAFAHMAFRIVYRSVYDEKDNHVPQESGAGPLGAKAA